MFLTSSLYVVVAAACLACPYTVGPRLPPVDSTLPAAPVVASCVAAEALPAAGGAVVAAGGLADASAPGARGDAVAVALPVTPLLRATPAAVGFGSVVADSVSVSVLWPTAAVWLAVPSGV